MGWSRERGRSFFGITSASHWLFLMHDGWMVLTIPWLASRCEIAYSRLTVAWRPKLFRDQDTPRQTSFPPPVTPHLALHLLPSTGDSIQPLR